jgi:hypothetical protein
MAGALVSVIVVSDFEERGPRSWRSERAILESLARQDIEQPFEVVLLEGEQHRDAAPPDLTASCAGSRVVYAPETQSARLKDFGVSQVTTDLVAVLEADCVPNPSWLRVLVDVLHRRPDVAAVSGRTSYGHETMYRRALSLVDRSFDDLGRPGVTGYVSNNGALYRRSLLEQFPYPPAASPFTSSRLRTQAMREAGHLFYFEPAAVMRHGIGGWGFIRDFRRHTGYSDMICSPTRGLRSIPGLLWRRRQREIQNCLRLGSTYLRWYDWPLTAVLLAAAPVLEVPGMLDAVGERTTLPKTAYH